MLVVNSKNLKLNSFKKKEKPLKNFNYYLTSKGTFNIDLILLHCLFLRLEAHLSNKHTIYWVIKEGHASKRKGFSSGYHNIKCEPNVNLFKLKNISYQTAGWIKKILVNEFAGDFILKKYERGDK